MWLLTTRSLLRLLAASPVGIAAFNAEFDHEKVQRSLEARTWALETRDSLGLSGLFGDLNTCDGCQVCALLDFDADLQMGWQA